MKEVRVTQLQKMSYNLILGVIGHVYFFHKRTFLSYVIEYGFCHFTSQHSNKNKLSLI